MCAAVAATSYLLVMVRKQVHLTGAQDEALKEASARLWVPEAQVIRTALDRHFGFGWDMSDTQRASLNDFLETAKNCRKAAKQAPMFNYRAPLPKELRFWHEHSEV